MSAKNDDSGDEENDNIDQSESSVSPEIFLPALESPASDSIAADSESGGGEKTINTTVGATVLKSSQENGIPSSEKQDSAHRPHTLPVAARSKSPDDASVGGLDFDLPPLGSYKVEAVDFPSSPTQMARSFTMPQENEGLGYDLEDDEEDRSIYRAILSPSAGDVHLKREKPSGSRVRRKKIAVSAEIFNKSHEMSEDEKSEDQDTLGKENVKGNEEALTDEDDELDDILSQDLGTPDEMEDSILERLGMTTPVNVKKDDDPVVKVPPIPELTAAEERAEERNWRECMVAGLQRRIDMRAIGPFKKVLSHGGYMPGNFHNAIILFSACYLPERSRPDYDYLMDNLFLYVVTTLEALVAEEYVLVYLHGAVGSPGSRMPTFSWLKRCYRLIDRRLRKNLRALYLVHPTFWLKTIVLMTRPFISSKFSRKLNFVNDLSELAEYVPLEQMHIPERVRQYDAIKQTLGAL
ncbi:protein prune homolog 2 isoform X2 [Ischnura elegans]|uniref:protein prune homolog 2 isoform X2 n=1 Tax=Ischnura elegans TaxID=197161 RepID=UPI001ED8B39A|nr:protein prune homolog 2 isoform X2 [Ischnura elegans]